MKNERKEPIQIPHIQTINDHISYLTPTEHPLSANVVIIEGDAFFWVYDVGNHPAVPEILQKKSKQTGKKIRVILSHFHPDHIGNLSEISCEAVYQGKNTFRYTKTGTVIEEDTWFQDGDVRLHLFPIPSSHAKGSLALEVDETWCFLGDAAYATQKNGQTIYNAERLLAEIRVLKNVRAPYFFLSHSEPFQRNKEDVLEWMEAIYEKRKRDESYIKTPQRV